MREYIGVDAESGLVRAVIGTATNINKGTQAMKLLQIEVATMFFDAGHQDDGKREEASAVHSIQHL